VGEQQVFVEDDAALLLAGFDRDGQRQAGQLGVGRPAVAVERQGDEGRAGLDDAQAELAGDAVAEVCGAYLRDRQPAGGDHDMARFDRPAVGRDPVTRPGRVRPFQRRDLAHRARLPARHAAGLALGQQHGDEVIGRAVAEQLALVFLVEGDAVPLHQRDEVLRGVAGEGGAA
jgi:hypothetical protein